MASTDYLPASDAAYAAWLNNFSSLISSDPPRYGLTSAIAVSVAAQESLFAQALQVATDPSTRTKPAVAAKDAARASSSAVARQAAQIVQATPGVTPDDIASLGLTVRSSSRPPVPPPSTLPLVTITSTAGQRVVMSLADSPTPTRKARPRGSIGAFLFWKVGTTAPTGLNDCKFGGLAVKFPAQIQLDSSTAGQTVWILARWANRRGETGPVSAVVSAIVAS